MLITKIFFIARTSTQPHFQEIFIYSSFFINSMKLFFSNEDSVFGILIGVILIGLSGKLFNIPNIPILYGILFGLSLVLTVLDILAVFTALHRHFMITALNWINNVVDAVLELAFIAYFFKLNIPFISTVIVPHLSSPSNLFIIGIFFVVVSIFWLIAHPFID